MITNPDLAAAMAAFGPAQAAGHPDARAHMPWLGAAEVLRAREAPNPATFCLKPLLAALGWLGDARYLTEAAGDQPLATLADLRAVLYRLNFVTSPVTVTAAQMPPSAFPFLLALPDGDIWVVLGAEANGRFTVFKGLAGMPGSAALGKGAAARGRIYTVAAARGETRRAAKAASGWTSAMLAGEAKAMRRLVGLTFAVNIVALGVPIYLIAVYDRAVAAKSLTSLAYLLVGVLLAMAVEMILREMRARSLAYLGARIEGLMMSAAFERLLLLPSHLIENASVGAQIARLKLFESMRDVFSGPLATALLDLPFILVFVFAVFAIGGPLGWLVVGFIVLLTLLIALSVPMARRHAAAGGEARAESHKFLMEFAENIEVIRRCGAEATWIDRYRALTQDSLAHAAAAHRTSVIEQTLSQSLVMLTGAAIIGFGAWMVIEGTFTAGALFAMMALIWRVLGPIQTAFLHLNKISQAAGIVRQVDQLMRIEPEYHPEAVPTVPRAFHGPIEMQGVVMRYIPGGEPTIRAVSLTVPRDGFIAITGHVGAGKSTLLKIMAQLYQPQAGTVLIDGLDYRQFDARLLRHAMGIVPQRQDLFSGSIAENIRMGDPAASGDAIRAILAELGGDDMLAGVDGGIDAPLDPRHPVTGSEAFRQKIMLARAFIGRPPIYLLDEPAARLDARDDDLLRARLQAMKGKATIVIATTRPSYMYLADKLIVLKAGQVIGQDAPNRVIAALLAEKFKGTGGARPPASPRDIADILPDAPAAAPTAATMGGKR